MNLTNFLIRHSTKSVLIFAWLILFNQQTNAQKFDINAVSCKINNSDVVLLNRIGKFEAKFYNVVFNTAVNDSLPVHINLYGKNVDFEKQEKDIANMTFSDGFYSPNLNQVYIYKDQRFMEVMLHETSHSLLHNNFRNPPMWLNEGIATLFGSLVIQENDIYYKTQTEYIRLLKNDILMHTLNLNTFFNYPYNYWHDKKKTNYMYGVSYCLIYFFVKDDIENLQRTLTLMKQGLNTTEALAKVFGSFEQFEKRFRDFYKPEVGYRM